MKCDELKAINAYQLTTNTEDSDVFIHNDEFGCGGDLVECYLKSEADAAIAKLNGENERLKKCEIWMKQHFYCEEVIACESAKNRRLKRALWLARAELCHRLDVDRYLRNHRHSWYNENCLTWADACVAMEVKICKAESKCRAKAEEYK